MDQKPHIEMIYLAISALYHNPDATEKESASQWLAELQNSVCAWTVADELLHHKRDLESCYFAAQTMRTKIHQSFHELDEHARTALRDSLLQHIGQINEATNPIIVVQLCLALADMVLQMPTWKGAPLELINKFSQNNIWPLLEILTVLPEELENRSLRLGDNRRYEVIDDLKACATTVMEFLNYCTTSYTTNVQDNVQVTTKILRCFTSWVSVGAITLGDISDNVVVSKAFLILGGKQETADKAAAVAGSLHDAATDCICTMLQSLENNNNQEALESYLFSNVIGLEAAYHMSVANEDQEKSMNYCRIFTELGESFLEKITGNTGPDSCHYAIKILDLVLICVGHHDYEVAEITFNLWYVLSEELYQKSNKQMTDVFRPYVERLIMALCRHCRMEPDHEGLLTEGDDFKDFRSKVYDLIKDVVFIVGSSSCFKQMFLYLQTPGVTWDSGEAALFIMQAVAKNVLPSENEVIPKVLQVITSLPASTHVAVRHTAIGLLGELCDWVADHPAALDTVLECLVQHLGRPAVAPAAAAALQSTCVACGPHMERHAPDLVRLLGQVDGFGLNEEAVGGLIKGAAGVIGCMSREKLPEAFRELSLMQMKPLMQLIEQDVAPVKGSKTDPVVWLDRLSSLLRHLDARVGEGESHPCKSVVVLEVWPVISRTFDKYQNDSRIMERCCRSVRFMLRCISRELCELLGQLVTQIVRIYSLYKHSCFLYVGSILVDEYAVEPTCIQGLLDMLQAFVQPTFEALEEENGLRDHPDTVDDFFRLCGRFIQRAPVTFLRCPVVTHVVSKGLVAIQLDHKEANKSVMRFFYDMINVGVFGSQNSPDYQTRRALVDGLLDRYGQQLVDNLIYASIFYLHSYMLCDIGDVLVELVEFDREKAAKMLSQALERLPKQKNGMVTATNQQISEIHRSLSRGTSSKAITYVLKDLTRLYR